MPVPDLYPHQIDQVARLRQSLARCRQAVLCANPGVGKTRMAKHIIARSVNSQPNENQTGHYLFAVHRRSLVDNASDSFNESPTMPHGVIMSGRDTDWHHRVQVASIDTMLAWHCDGGYSSSRTYDLVVFDECMIGATQIVTDLGHMRIDEVPLRKPRFVQSFADGKIVFNRILNWKHSGNKHTIEVHTHHGKIVCTGDHKVFTRRGWLPASELSDTDEMLVCADAASDHGQGVSCGGGIKHGSPKRIMSRCGNTFIRSLRFASADAANRLRPFIQTLRRGFSSIAPRPSATTVRAILNVPLINRWCSRLMNDRHCSVRSWEIRPLATQTVGVGTQGFTARTDCHNNNGPNTKPGSCIDWAREPESWLTLDGVINLSSPQPSVSPVWRRFIQLSNTDRKNESPNDGWIRSGRSGWRGGLVMTGRDIRPGCLFTPKGTPRTKIDESPNGCQITSVRQASLGTGSAATATSVSPVGHKSNLRTSSDRTCRNVCTTSWSRVIRIVPANPMDVYDIEVENTHCFFADGHLVHNCHSHLAKLQKFLELHNVARQADGKHLPYVIGLSATPQATGLADIFGDIVTGESTQWLTEHGYLVPFRYFRAAEGRLDLLRRRAGEFTAGSLDEAFSGLAGELVRDWQLYGEGRPTVGFFSRLSHAREAVGRLQEAGIAAAYVDGKTPDDERQALYRSLASGGIQYLCNVGVVERGTNIPAIGCVQLCLAIGSVVRYRQMIGRGSRTAPGKENCIVIDHGGNVMRHGFFEDDVNWTLDMSRTGEVEHSARPTFECPRCHRIYRGGRCRECSYEPSQRERRSAGLDFNGRELVEVQREQKPRELKTAEQILISSIYRMASRNGTWRQAVAVAYKTAAQQGVPFTIPRTFEVSGTRYRSIRKGDPEGARRLKQLFEFVSE